MQTQWPGLGPTFDLSSLDGASGDGRQLWPNNAAPGASPALPSDAIGPSWWSCGTANANAGNPFGGLLGSTTGAANGSSGTLVGLVSGLVTMLQQLVGTLLNQGASPNASGLPNAGAGQSPNSGAWQSPLPNGPQQQFQNVDVSSTGDPHIAETGTQEGPGGQNAVDVRWDSMTSHGDLVHSNQIDGGYRVSTAVTQPDANGVTSNQSATVHTNFDQDSVTMNRDGSFSIFDNGQPVQLGKGESADLSGGETVTANQDGSLNVSASNGNGGAIATTLRSTGAGVDVTTHAHEIALGGDAITHGAHNGRGGHKRPHTPVAQQPAVPVQN
jgi:hypothetical protein